MWQSVADMVMINRSILCEEPITTFLMVRVVSGSMPLTCVRTVINRASSARPVGLVGYDRNYLIHIGLLSTNTC